MSLRIATGTDGSVKERKGLKRKFAAYAGLAFGLILIAGLFAGCGKKDTADADVDLSIFAAKSLNGVMDEICAAYTRAHPNVNFRNNYDLLNNQVCLVTYKNSGTAVTGFADISKAKNMALADGTVPVGQYTRAALVNSKMVEGDDSKPQDISDSDISKALDGLEINSCANVGAVASAVAEGANEIGTVYYSDTFGYENQLDIIEKLPNSLTGDVIYPIAALKGDSTTSDELEAAKEFIAYLQTDEAMSVFEKYHFSVNK